MLPVLYSDFMVSMALEYLSLSNSFVSIAFGKLIIFLDSISLFSFSLLLMFIEFAICDLTKKYDVIL